MGSDRIGLLLSHFTENDARRLSISPKGHTGVIPNPSLGSLGAQPGVEGATRNC